MGIYVIAGTITGAIRIKDVLIRNKIRAVVKKNSLIDKEFGCGYGVLVQNMNYDNLVKILQRSGVGYKKIVMKNK